MKIGCKVAGDVVKLESERAWEKVVAARGCASHEVVKMHIVWGWR